MFTSDAIVVFGSPSAIAKKIGVSRQAVGQWGELVPPLSAAKLAKVSQGKLKFDPDLYEEWNNRGQRPA
jgi:transcriptional repressor of cell division inhibition gene dicB